MSLTGISANRLELLQIAEAVAREKAIDKEIVIEAIEDAIQKGARARYGAEHDIRVGAWNKKALSRAQAKRSGGCSGAHLDDSLEREPSLVDPLGQQYWKDRCRARQATFGLPDVWAPDLVHRYVI